MTTPPARLRFSLAMLFVVMAAVGIGLVLVGTLSPRFGLGILPIVATLVVGWCMLTNREGSHRIWWSGFVLLASLYFASTYVVGGFSSVDLASVIYKNPGLSSAVPWNAFEIGFALFDLVIHTFFSVTVAMLGGSLTDLFCRRLFPGISTRSASRANRLSSREHSDWFCAGGALSSGIVEGFNNKLKLITRRSYGFRTLKAYEIALYHNLGALPEPKFTHEFF